ncbi:MAG: hypothetical protein HY423_05020 [Candidatus Lambdaproteobacteria bacterium]|nr:hypothetical protein [Candidatus Lambdaproteobacteria bacterium]
MPEHSPYYRPEEVAALARRGVAVAEPRLVAIGREVPLERIAAGVRLHPFCRIVGAQTRIDAGAEIGRAGPATLEETQVGARAVVGDLGPVTLREVCLGPGTVLGCGAAEQAVFLGKEGREPPFTAGYGFRVRAGSLYEEDSSSAQHTDTKMTILFPWVTLGSNLNWCDLLVAGGTAPELGRFSEVGSGAIHFNFTPRGDKATGSLLGNVTDGVFLDRPRLFIGGNSSVIGPVRVAFGAITPAGARLRGEIGPGATPAEQHADAPSDRGGEIYGSVARVYRSQVLLIGELAALDGWYGEARARIARGDPDQTELYRRGRELVPLNLTERVRQLGALVARLEGSIALLEAGRPGDPRIAQQRALVEHWPRIERHLLNHAAAVELMPAALRDGLAESAARHGRVYTRVVQGLPPAAVAAGRAWLRGIAGRVATPEMLAAVPTLGSGR